MCICELFFKHPGQTWVQAQIVQFIYLCIIPCKFLPNSICNMNMQYPISFKLNIEYAISQIKLHSDYAI